MSISSIACDLFPIVSLIRSVDPGGEAGDNVQSDIAVVVTRVLDNAGNAVAVTLVILRRDSHEVIYTGTIRADWTLHVFPLFTACQWEDANGIYLLGFQDLAILNSFVELFQLGRQLQQ